MYRRYSCIISYMGSVLPYIPVHIYTTISWIYNLQRGNHLFWRSVDLRFGYFFSRRTFFPLLFASQFLESYRAAMAENQIVVDSFFTIGGLLVSYKMFKLLKKYVRGWRVWWYSLKLNINLKIFFLEMENWIFYRCIGIVICG